MFGVFVFATFTTSSQDDIGQVVVWGSVSGSVVDKLFTHIRDARNDFGDVTYTEFPESTLVPSMVEAIAAGRGPDLILFPASAMVKDGEKLAPIPYNSVPRRDFQDTFVEAGEVFLQPDGVAALPVIIDPLVLYWNRTLFSNAAIATPPRYWDDVVKIAPQLTQRTPNGSITMSAIALGGWGNIAHAKGILVSIIRQLGSPVVSLAPNGKYQANLLELGSGAGQPAASAVRYYIDFADPVKPMYSWNRSQKNSREAFLQGTLAMYIAPASELLAIRNANPNLNFDIAPLPISRGAGSGVSAEVIGAAVPRGAKNPAGATVVAVLMASKGEQEYLATLTNLPSPRRDVELPSSADAYLSVFRASALRSFSFLDPEPSASDAVFARMIDNIASGRTILSEALGEAQEELEVLLEVQ